MRLIPGPQEYVLGHCFANSWGPGMACVAPIERQAQNHVRKLEGGAGGGHTMGIHKPSPVVAKPRQRQPPASSSCMARRSSLMVGNSRDASGILLGLKNFRSAGSVPASLVYRRIELAGLLSGSHFSSNSSVPCVQIQPQEACAGT